MKTGLVGYDVASEFKTDTQKNRFYFFFISTTRLLRSVEGVQSNIHADLLGRKRSRGRTRKVKGVLLVD